MIASKMGNNSKFFFVLLSVSAAIGIGNIWVYPYGSYKYGGLFIIPYLIALIVLGVPLLMLEFSIGQYFNKNVVDLFASIRKGFSSIGWLILFNAFILMSVYAVVLSWSITYFFVSFGLQWKNDSKSYFFNNVLQVSDGFTNFFQFSLPVFIALILAWLIVFLYIRKGFESIKKYYSATFAVFIFLMLLFMAYSLALDNALNGIYAFLKPNLKSLIDLKVWVSAFSLAMLSLGLSFGVMPAFARKSGKGFIIANSFIVAIFKFLISIAVGFIVFGILGFLSAKQGLSLDSLAFSDFGSSFVVLTQALPFLYKPTLFSLLFFIFLSIIFIFAATSLAYSASHVLVHKFNTQRRNAAVIVSGFGFLFGLLFIIKPGFYIMDIMVHFIYYNILIAVLLEVIAVGWFFDFEKISQHINQNSELKIGGIWRFFIRYIAPLIIVLLLFFQLKSDFLLNYKNYPWIYVMIFGVGTVAFPIILAFLMPQKILDKR